MTKTKVTATTSVDDIFSMIKAPSGNKDGNLSKCKFIKKIEELPSNVLDALMLAVHTEDVSNRDILAFVNTQTEVRINLTMLQKHRAKAGCMDCLYGGVNV